MNTPESDTMKTLTELSVEQGAIQPKRFEDFGTFNSKSILFHDEAQLLATIHAYNAQNSIATKLNELGMKPPPHLVNTGYTHVICQCEECLKDKPL